VTGAVLRRCVTAAVAVAVGLAAVVGCGGDDAAPTPRVEWIAPAVEAVEASLGVEPELLEVSANLEHVDVIVRDEPGQGVLYRYDDGELSGPVEPRPDEREPFVPDDIELDPARIFDGVRAELPTATIIDLAIRREGGGVVIDSTLASEAGGLLLVLLAPNGAVLGSQAV
jgi:hypothetical protein